MFHSLSNDIVRFKIEVRLRRKHLTHAKWPFLQHGAYAVPLMTPFSSPILHEFQTSSSSSFEFEFELARTFAIDSTFSGLCQLDENIFAPN